MTRLKNVLGDLWSILFLTKYSLAKRFWLMLAYIKVVVLSFLHGRITNIKSVKFLGFKVEIENFTEFSMLVREVFAGQPYYVSSCRSPKKIIDAGSNIGMSVLYFKWMYPDAEILAIEPDPDVFSILEKNVKDNNLKYVSLVQAAVAEEEGKLTFYKRKGLSIASTTTNINEKQSVKVEVPAKKLSGLVEEDADLLKIDIQFGEASVFTELAESGSIKRFKNIVLEYHYQYDYLGNELSAVLSTFEQNGFDYKIELSGDKQNRFRTYRIEAELVR